MKSYYLFAMFSLAMSLAGASEYREPFTRAGKFSPKGRVSLENVNGDITIRTWDKPEIRIEGEKDAKTEADLKAIELTIDLTDDRAAIRVRLPKRHGWFGGSIQGGATFTLTVPASVSLDAIQTVNSSVSVSGVSGSVHIETVNGRIQAEHLGGPALLKTVNGSVRARFDHVRNQSIAAHSVNGSVELGLPSETGATLRASVVNGGIECDFPTEIQGRFIMKNLHGKVGNGAASVNVETVNGGVRIKKT